MGKIPEQIPHERIYADRKQAMFFIREMPVQTRYHFTSNRMPEIPPHPAKLTISTNAQEEKQY